MRKTLFVKKSILFAVVIMVFVVFPGIAFPHGFEPLYVAYPAEYHQDRIAARIEALPANMEYPVLTEDQQQQYELFRILKDLPGENSRQAISPGLAQSLSRNVHDHRDRYFRMFSQGGVDQVPDYLAAGLFLHNSVWSTNHSVMMLWLYNFRIPSIRTYLSLSNLLDRRGVLAGAEMLKLLD